jgi:predicted amidohydrolase YtcJ
MSINPSPQSIFYNGRIHAMDNKINTYEAMAVAASGKILALGTNEEILALRGSKTYIYNLKNHVVIPGLIETHTHIFRVGLSELHEEKFIPASINELLEYIKGKVQVLKPGEWIYFHNTYPTRLKEYRFPTLEELDAVAPNNPVYMDGAYAGQANSYALRLLNINENIPEPKNGKFIRGKLSGELTGLLFCCSDIVKKAFRTKNDTIEDIKKGLLNIQASYHKYGITSVVDGMTGEVDIKALNELYKEGKLGLRTILTGMVSSLSSAGENLERLKALIDLPCEWGKLSFCKVILDGGILTGTAYMRRPYNDTLGVFGINFDDFKGIIHYNSSQLKNIIDIAIKTNLQMTAHCIGDETRIKKAGGIIRKASERECYLLFAGTGNE